MNRFAFALALIAAPVAGGQGVAVADDTPNQNPPHEPLQPGGYYDPEDASETVFMFTPEVTFETEEDLETMLNDVPGDLEEDRDDLEDNPNDPKDGE
ncbi:MAG: hypothetical protein HEP70_13865 [Rhodobiaceae bacterium]|nr:hypothetical protein [Rhodobiaceae bacterium]